MVETHDMRGKRVLVTGANDGIGRATARALAVAGAHVLLHGRDPAKVEAAAADIRAAGGGEVEGVVADFARLAEVARLADEVIARHNRLDVLVNNAGLIRDRLILTEDGVEEVFQINHLAHFLLTLRLLPALERAGAGRVVTVASGAHGMVKGLDLEQLAAPRRYDPMQVYAASKACNILFSQELARRTEGRGIVANALHPGVIRSGFGSAEDVAGRVRWLFKLARPLMKTPEQGAATSVFLASAHEGGTATGGYFIRCRPAEPRTFARDPATAQRLWELSERLVAPHLPEEALDGPAG